MRGGGGQSRKLSVISPFFFSCPDLFEGRDTIGTTKKTSQKRDRNSFLLPIVPEASSVILKSLGTCRVGD